jgi:hypothetical protein
MGEAPLRVFISSTEKDLKAQRRAAKEVVLQLRWFPVMMEYFGPGVHLTVKECLDEIGRCDLVIWIAGYRYGWVPTAEVGGREGKSITMLEVEHARSRSIPIVHFLAEGWPVEKVEEFVREEEGDQFKRARALMQASGQVFGRFTPEDSFDEAPKLPVFRNQLKHALLNFQQARQEPSSFIDSTRASTSVATSPIPGATPPNSLPPLTASSPRPGKQLPLLRIGAAVLVLLVIAVLLGMRHRSEGTRPAAVAPVATTAVVALQPVAPASDAPAANATARVASAGHSVRRSASAMTSGSANAQAAPSTNLAGTRGTDGGDESKQPEPPAMSSSTCEEYVSKLKNWATVPGSADPSLKLVKKLRECALQCATKKPQLGADLGGKVGQLDSLLTPAVAARDGAAPNGGAPDDAMRRLTQSLEALRAQIRVCSF